MIGGINQQQRQDMQPFEIEPDINPPPHYFGNDYNQPLVTNRENGVD